MMGLQAVAAISTVDNEECSSLALEDKEKDLVSQLLLYVLTALMPMIHDSAMLGNWMFGMMANLILKGSRPMPFHLTILAASFLLMHSLDYFYLSMFSYPWPTNPVLISYHQIIYHPQCTSHCLILLMIFKPLQTLMFTSSKLYFFVVQCVMEGVLAFSLLMSLDSVWRGINNWCAKGLGTGEVSALVSRKLSVSGISKGAEGQLMILDELFSVKKICLCPITLVRYTTSMCAPKFGFYFDTVTRCCATTIFTHYSSSLTSLLLKNRIPAEFTHPLHVCQVMHHLPSYMLSATELLHFMGI